MYSGTTAAGTAANGGGGVSTSSSSGGGVTTATGETEALSRGNSMRTEAEKKPFLDGVGRDRDQEQVGDIEFVGFLNFK